MYIDLGNDKIIELNKTYVPYFIEFGKFFLGIK